MWKEIITLFKSSGPLQEAYDEAILMLHTSHSMFDDIVPALEDSDEALARTILRAHGGVSESVDAAVRALTAGEVMSARGGHAVTVALYLRFLKRVSAHLKNVATSVVNPYHRFGFREK